MSELLPNLAQHVDKMCWLRGLHTDTPRASSGRRAIAYGFRQRRTDAAQYGCLVVIWLGTENQDVPGYITINPPANFGGVVNYGSAFLPAHFQGSRITDEGFVPNLKPQVAQSLQRKQLDYIQKLNRKWAAEPSAPDAVEGIIESYEIGLKMQGKVPELLDISSEPQHVLDAYGVKVGPQGAFARQCLMARRLSEAGVRFVEIRQGGWDHHNNLHKGLLDRCQSIDQPTAALLADLQQRGLLEDTLVLFGSEFGRQPTAQGEDGRDHNITGYPMFLVGAGVKPGFSYGSSDEYGVRAVEGRMHTNDLHATLLALMD